MSKSYINIVKIFSRIESNIAFYPTIIAFAGFAFAILMFYAESRGISGYLIEHAPALVIDNLDTARTILSVFIGGLISIMVFSFSMVMILLNNAASNFSPRVLPGLISNRRHQFILGIYNSTLIYCIFTLVSLEPTGDKWQLPGFSVLLAILGMLSCLGAFIYFLHSISQEIQVDNIMKKISTQAHSRMKELFDNEKLRDSASFADTSDFSELKSKESGYFQDIAEKGIKRIAVENEIKVEIVPIKGTFVYKGDVIAKINMDLDDDAQKSFYNQFVFSNNELIEDNYVLAFKQITEIAVKAMSPGINDPGTAVNAIDYLTELFLRRMKTSDEVYFYENNKPFVKFKVADFETILYGVMASLRTYASHDIILATKMLSMLTTMLKSKDCYKQEYKFQIISEIKNLQSSVQESVAIAYDRDFFNDKMHELKEKINF